MSLPPSPSTSSRSGSASAGHGTARGGRRDRSAGDALPSWILAEPYAYPLVLGAVAAGSGGARRRGPPEPHRVRAARRGCDTCTRCSSSRSRSASQPQRSSSVSDDARCSRSCDGKHSCSAPSCFRSPRCSCSHRASSASTATSARSTRRRLAHRTSRDERVHAPLRGRMGGRPGALFGLGLALARLALRSSSASALCRACWRSALLLQASIYGDLDRAQGRYFFYVVPLVALLFCLYASRGWPHARAYALVAISGLVLSALVPLSGYAEGIGKTQSVVLLGVYRVEELLGVGTGALVVALVAAAGSLLAAALPRIGRRGETIGLVATIALLAGRGASSRRASTSATRTRSAQATCRRRELGRSRRGSETSRSCTSRPVAPTRSRSSSGTAR